MMMAPHLLATHIALAMLLFWIVNWIGKHSTAWGYLQLSLAVRADDAPAFNFVFRVLTPIVYLIIVSAILYAAGLDLLVNRIYFVIIYYFILRVAYNVVLGRTRLMNWRLQITYA